MFVTQEIVNSSKFESSFSSKALESSKPDLFQKSSTPKTSDFQKSEFGSFSLLETPKLLAMSKGGSSDMESKKFQSSSMEQLNSLSNSYSPRATYSTTIERSVNTGKNGFTAKVIFCLFFVFFFREIASKIVKNSKFDRDYFGKFREFIIKLKKLKDRILPPIYFPDYISFTSFLYMAENNSFYLIRKEQKIALRSVTDQCKIDW